MPKISVLITIYNRAHLINRCLDSVYKNNFDDYNIILVDDGSTDDLDSHLVNYDDRLNVYHVNHNGFSSTLNFGLDKLDSQYVVLMDSDDTMAFDRLEKQYNWMEEHPGIDLMGCLLESPSGYRIKNTTGMDYKVTLDNITKRHLFHPTMIYRMDSINKKHLRYNETLRCCVDFEFFVKALKSGLHIWHSNEMFGGTHVHQNDSLSIIYKEEQKANGNKIIKDLIS